MSCSSLLPVQSFGLWGTVLERGLVLIVLSPGLLLLSWGVSVMVRAECPVQFALPRLPPKGGVQLFMAVVTLGAMLCVVLYLWMACEIHHEWRQVVQVMCTVT